MRSYTNAGWAPAATLKATKLSRERAGQLVLNDISLTVAPGDRIGVVGPNGVGKTTLLRMLAGLDVPDRGRVEVSPPGAKVGYLAQERDHGPGESVPGQSVPGQTCPVRACPVRGCPVRTCPVRTWRYTFGAVPGPLMPNWSWTEPCSASPAGT